MTVLTRRDRQGPVLTPSSLPCLGDVPTINITEGCAHACAYCYTRGYSRYPGTGRVVLLENTPELVRAELSRRRRRPRRVYFSPSSDPFQPLEEVLAVTHRMMSILLGSGVEVAFLTKGIPHERTMELVAASPTSVFAQVGITTLSERLQRALEPGAASPGHRLRLIERLGQAQVAPMARLDPLIPDLTDTDGSLLPLLAELARHGVRSIAASYLFLRPPFAQQLCERLREVVGRAYSAAHWSWQKSADGIGGGRMLGPADRQRRYARLQALAAQYGIEVHVCACKNPGLPCAADCQIAGPPRTRRQKPALPLFPSLD